MPAIFRKYNMGGDGKRHRLGETQGTEEGSEKGKEGEQVIPLGVYVRHNQPEQYAALRALYRLPRLPAWAEDDELTLYQRMLDKVMRYIPRTGRG